MDLDAVADELYGLVPGEFTAARDQRARQARAEGQRELAARIRELRRPTLAAWASNLLVREQPSETGPLLRLGEALRQAHRDLDGDQLRELSARQRQVITALTRQAGRLAERAGQPIGESTRRAVEGTLHAVLADPGAGDEWMRGRLTRPLTASADLSALTAPTGIGTARTASKPARGDRKAPGDRKARGDRGDRRDRRGESPVADLDAARARRGEQRRKDDEARRNADEKARELHGRQDELQAVRDEADRAADRHRGADARVTELRRLLADAEAEQRAARDAARAARERLRAAERAAGTARRRAREAAARADRLDTPPGRGRKR